MAQKGLRPNHEPKKQGMNFLNLPNLKPNLIFFFNCTTNNLDFLKINTYLVKQQQEPVCFLNKVK